MRPGPIGEAGAVPAFARKYGLACQQCHTAWPLLNDYGRQFKLNGYVREPGSKEGTVTGNGDYWTEKLFPISVIGRAFPYDKDQAVNQEFAMQGFSDADFFIAGGDASRRFSYFGEIDVNSAAGFTPAGNDYSLGYHPSQYLNIVGARRGYFVMDPYMTLANFGNPTITPRGTSGLYGNAQLQADEAHLSQDTMDETNQTIEVFGEADSENAGGLYYSAGVTGTKNDNAGTGPKSANGRLAYDTLKGFMLGTFGSWGRQNVTIPAPGVGATGNKTMYSREGVDMLAEYKNFAARGAFVLMQDRDLVAARFNDVDTTQGGGVYGNVTIGQETNKAAYAECLYTLKLAGSTVPFLVPLVRYNWFTTFNSTRSFEYVTAQLAHYFRANAKGYVEYTTETKEDVQGTNNVRSPKDSRLSVGFELGI
jgi:hypothetical protein